MQRVVRSIRTRPTFLPEWRNGRRAGFKTQWGNPWGFKSLLRYHNGRLAQLVKAAVSHTADRGFEHPTVHQAHAVVVELADTLVSEANGGNPIPVQVRATAPMFL